LLVCPLTVDLPLQPMSATAISLGWAVPAVVPVCAGGVLPLMVAIASRGDVVAPEISITVNASVVVAADVPPTVTVTAWELARPAAFAAYQSSPSALASWVTLVALTQGFPAESVTLLTGANAVVLRSLITATRRSPPAVVPLGEAASDAPPVDADWAPND
jgi:hypothetical protein